jgi:hypothetical protein
MNPAIRVSVEAPRGCGFRKEGGIYLVCDGFGRHCGKLPLPLDCCPTCGGGIKFCRSWTWVNATALFDGRDCTYLDCGDCPLAKPLGRAGLLWIGETHYPTPDAYLVEANRMGVSRRIAAVPRDFILGRTWVLLAHAQGIENPDGSTSPAIFHAFRPSRIEKIVSGKESDEEIEKLVQQGITPVVVEKTLGEPEGEEVEVEWQDEDVE